MISCQHDPGRLVTTNDRSNVVKLRANMYKGSTLPGMRVVLDLSQTYSHLHLSVTILT